ncbi:MAG: DUF192 domain-containing protein [Thermoanaerobaculales bacterium]|jgi:hypothetical protein|nr:DUF192 domain-containing protein [Thermoanaerobaculales bacterium]
MTNDAVTRARSVLILGGLTVSLALTVACSPAPDAGPTAGTIPGGSDPTTVREAPADRPLALLPDGFPVSLELAITPEELAQGLMFRPSLASDRGMLLVFSEERLPNIWMMNTLVALDLVYLDRAGIVVDVVTNAQPCPAEPCPRFTPRRPAQAVLEIPAGGVERHGVTIGSVIEVRGVPDYPATD